MEFFLLCIKAQSQDETKVKFGEITMLINKDETRITLNIKR